MFLIFDVETAFLYPFAVYFNQFGFYVIVETFIFVGLLLFGLYLDWYKGYFNLLLAQYSNVH